MRSALVIALAASCLAAQSTKVVPGVAAALDGNDKSYFPFLYDKTRVQQIWDGSTICNASAVLFGINMRRDAADPMSQTGYTIPNLILTLGHAVNGPRSRCNAFSIKSG